MMGKIIIIIVMALAMSLNVNSYRLGANIIHEAFTDANADNCANFTLTGDEIQCNPGSGLYIDTILGTGIDNIKFIHYIPNMSTNTNNISIRFSVNISVGIVNALYVFLNTQNNTNDNANRLIVSQTTPASGVYNVYDPNSAANLCPLAAYGSHFNNITFRIYQNDSVECYVNETQTGYIPSSVWDSYTGTRRPNITTIVFGEYAAGDGKPKTMGIKDFVVWNGTQIIQPVIPLSPLVIRFSSPLNHSILNNSQDLLNISANCSNSNITSFTYTIGSLSYSNNSFESSSNMRASLNISTLPNMTYSPTLSCIDIGNSTSLVFNISITTTGIFIPPANFTGITPRLQGCDYTNTELWVISIMIVITLVLFVTSVFSANGIIGALSAFCMIILSFFFFGCSFWFGIILLLIGVMVLILSAISII